MCLSFLLAFACTVVRVLLLEGKCIASLQEDPAEDSLCLACFCLRRYSARAWTWPPLLWWETGLLLLLNGFSLFTAGPLFQPWAAEILQTGGRSHISSDLYLFPGAGPLFQPWAAEILQKGGRRHISSDLYLFPGAGPLFQPWAAEILQKGALQLDLNVASILASTCFFLWRRESALLLCKRIPLKIVYAWPASVAPLQCKGLNLTSASVMGNWTASFAERLLLILRWTPFPAVSGRDPPKRGAAATSVQTFTFFSRRWTPLFQPWAAEILQKGAPQPDIKRAATWFFSVPLPHIEAVPLSALSVPVLCACLLVRVAFFWQIPFPKHCSEWALPSTPFTPGWPSSVGRADGS